MPHRLRQATALPIPGDNTVPSKRSAGHASRRDPRHADEAARYENPIASREFILATLEHAGVPLTLEELAVRLDLEAEDRCEALRRRLRAMARDGQLVCNRRGAWGAVARMDLVRGTVQASREGHGFLVPADGGDDLYLQGRQMRRVFHGDEVLARVTGLDHRGRREAAIVEVLKRNTELIVGRIRRQHGVNYVVAENPRIQHEVLVRDADCAEAHEGQYVTVRIVTPPAVDAPPTGAVVEVLGDHMAPGMEIEVALRTHDVPFVWPNDVRAEAVRFAPEPRRADKARRMDLRELAFVTIDGEDAKDFDDAVYCERRRGSGWRLWVAIADVSHYVTPGAPLDAEARRRGTSVYFPGRVVPMLPEELSNGLCSLQPEVDRLALVCEMEIARDGSLGRFWFAEAVIRSAARLTYTRVAATLAGEDAGIAPALAVRLQELHALYRALRAARDERGAIDFETSETRIVFGPDRKIEEVMPVERNDAHKLIEECMLAANVATARFLQKHRIPALYRVHEGPSGEKLESLRRFLGELGLSLRGGDKPQPGDYQSLIASVQERPDRHVIESVMLRSLSQARYQPENLGHFGLNYPAYAHFTSPIRRYPDLLVHRALRSVIRAQSASTQVRRVEGAKLLAPHKTYPYDLVAMNELGEHCSMAERRADEAARDVMNWLKCEYLQDRVGEVFDGVVSGVTGFGLFVELQEVYADGLVHVATLQNDYYHFDASGHRLIGDRTRRVYRLGDRVRVQIARVDLDERKIDLLIDEDAARGRRKVRVREGGSRRTPHRRHR
ncbi:MAG: ribonuclease R [Pseudomonadales bacterium]|jgi:ribonuclease R|nr:ribonuclease R [Pseudomonadales bacterium]MCP5321373.1 ribonuclease R [Pseudomonadales bacterium]MCP5336283.1 ribonuclease R [Pseudomonadales bacterium]